MAHSRNPGWGKQMPDNLNDSELPTVSDVESEEDASAGSLPVSGQTWGKYLIEKFLGSGGQAAVFQAFDRFGPAGHVALKLPNDLIPASRIEAWTQNEVDPLGKLQHPNIVRVLDAGEVDGVPYLATELIEGESLTDHVKKSPPLDGQILDWMIQLTDAMEYAHSRGVTHRDLKPGNIIMATDRSSDPNWSGRPRVIDFGISSLTTPFQNSSQPGRSCTPQFAAPEQVVASRDADHRVDIFALGGMLKFLLVGTGPYGQMESMEECVDAARNARIERVDCTSGSHVRRSLGRIANRAISADPDQRYRNAGDMLKALRWIRNRRKLLRAAICAVVLVTAVVLGAMAIPGRDEPVPPTAIETSFNIHFQRAGQEGSYQILTADLLPLKTGDRIQIHATFAEPLSACLLAVDPGGNVSILHPSDGGPVSPTKQITIPKGRDQWLPLTGPGGIETIVLLARREAIDDPQKFKDHVQSLGPAPSMNGVGMLITDKTGVRFIANKAETHRALGDKPVTVEKGFLAALSEAYTDEWDIIRAICFPHTSAEKPGAK